MKRFKILACALAWLCIAIACNIDNNTTSSGTHDFTPFVTNNRIHEENCSSFHNLPELCLDFRNGDTCDYDSQTGKCTIKSFAQDEDTSIDCRVYDEPELCREAGCEWKDSQCVKNAGPQDIFVWQKLELPAGLSISDLDKFVVSNDNAHLYIYTSMGLQKGLYHSADNGQNWTYLETLKAKPFNPHRPKGNPNSAVIKTAEVLDYVLATEHGVMVVQGTKIALLVADQALWALDANEHYDAFTNFMAHRRVRGIARKKIAYAAIINTPTGEAVVFRQEDKSSLLFHHTSKNFDERPVIKTPHSANSTLKIMWTNIANSYDNGILLYAPGKVMKIPEHSCDWTKDWHEQSLAGRAQEIPGFMPWPHGDNDKVGMIASVNNNGEELVILGLEVASIKPVQSGGITNNATPELSLIGKSIIGTELKYDGVVRLISANHGLIALNNDGTLNPDRDFDFKAISLSVLDMMNDNKSAVELKGNNNKLRGVYGNKNDRAYFWITGVGLFLRSKTIGLARS